VLDLKAVDLQALCEALEDHSDYTEWWFDPKSGAVEPWSSDLSALDGPEETHPAERGWVQVEPLPSHESYDDLADFTERVRDSRARDLLERAIAGRGAFRRFKDTLFEFPELRQAWFGFHDVRMERRALDWLVDQGVVEEDAAERAVEARPDPDLPQLSGPFDSSAIAREVADDLRRLYGDRLRKVLLFGSWARGDAHLESDIDLLVVLDELDSPWEELARMDEILDRHSVENETVVSAMPVAEDRSSNRHSRAHPRRGRGASGRLTRSRRELEAARFLAGGGFAEQTISRAYYAAFSAAEDALLALGESRSKHSGVLAAFEMVAVPPKERSRLWRSSGFASAGRRGDARC